MQCVNYWWAAVEVIFLAFVAVGAFVGGILKPEISVYTCTGGSLPH
jgi:hypothetical protein